MEKLYYAMTSPLFRGATRGVVQDKRLVIVYNNCKNNNALYKVIVRLKCIMFKAQTADTLSHTCRNSFIKFCYRLFPPFRYVKHNNIIAKGGIWCGTLPQTADTLSHTCRNSFIKFSLPFIPAVLLR